MFLCGFFFFSPFLRERDNKADILNTESSSTSLSAEYMYLLALYVLGQLERYSIKKNMNAKILIHLY